MSSSIETGRILKSPESLPPDAKSALKAFIKHEETYLQGPIRDLFRNAPLVVWKALPHTQNQWLGLLLLEVDAYDFQSATSNGLTALMELQITSGSVTETLHLKYPEQPKALDHGSNDQYTWSNIDVGAQVVHDNGTPGSFSSRVILAPALYGKGEITPVKAYFIYPPYSFRRFFGYWVGPKNRPPLLDAVVITSSR